MEDENNNWGSKVLLLLGIILLFTPLCYATEATVKSIFISEDYIFKQSTQGDLIAYCSDAGNEDCNSTVSCAMTILYPNNTVLVENQAMKNNSYYYDYQLSAAQNALSGVYHGKVKCDAVGNSNITLFDYQVTPTGNQNNPTGFLIVIIGSLILLLLSFIFENYIMAFFSGIIFIASSLYTYFFGFGFYLGFDTKILSVLLLGLGLIILFASTFNYLEEMSGGDNSNKDSSESEEE